MNQDNHSNIIVSFTGPQKKLGHYVYAIVGTDTNGEFNVVRRYSDFNLLRDTLTQRWPGCYIPSIPQKKLLGADDPIYINMRKFGLQFFINEVKNAEYLWYSQEFQLFLRKVGDPQKQMSKLKETNVNQVLDRLKSTFPQFQNKQISKDLNNQIIEFNQYLKKAKGLLQNLQLMTEQIFTCRKKSHDKFINLLEVVLPGYERNCISVYKKDHEDELVFTGLKEEKIKEFIQKLKGKQNQVTYVLDGIKQERLQVLAFEQIIRLKQSYSVKKHKALSKVKDLQIETTKIHSGKQSFFSKIKGKSKQVQLKQNKQSIEKAQQQQKSLNLLCQMITLLLGQSQIPKFKKIRQQAYYHMLRKFFTIQKESSILKRQFWQYVGKQNITEKQEVDNFFEAQKIDECENQVQKVKEASNVQEIRTDVQTQVTEKQNFEQNQQANQHQNEHQPQDQQENQHENQENEKEVQQQKNQQSQLNNEKVQETEEIKSSDEEQHHQNDPTKYSIEE